MKYADLIHNISQFRTLIAQWQNGNQNGFTDYESQFAEFLDEIERYLNKFHDEEQNYRRIVENMQDVYYRADLNGNLVMVSPAIKKMIGYDPEEVVGWEIAENFYADPSKRTELLEKLQKTGSVQNYEVDLKHKDGRIIPILSNSHFIYDRNANPTGIEGTFTDITERKKVEEALKESEEKYRSIVDNAPTGIFIVNDHYKFVYSNNKLGKILGYEKKEILSMDFRNILDESSLKLVSERYKKRQRGEAVPPKYDIKVLRKDGRKIDLELRVAVIELMGRIKHSVGQVLDITENKKAEENLRNKEQKLLESEEKFRTLINQLPVGVYRTTADGNFVYYNSTLAQMLGYTSEELSQIQVLSLYIDQKERDQTLKMISNQHIKTIKNEIRLKTKQGKILIVNDHVSAKYDENGHFKYFDGVLEDITERKKTEEALRESEYKFRQLAQTTSTAILAYQDEYWVYANPAAERISGYKEEELKKMKYWEIVAPEYREMIRSRGQQRQKLEEVPTGYEFKIMHKDGSIKWVYLEGALMEYQGKPAGLISVIDISRIKCAEEELKDRNNELRATEEELVSTNNALKEFNQQLEQQKKELEKAKNRAEENEAKSKSLLTAIPDMIFVFSKEGYITDYHAEKKDFLYTQPNQFLNQKVDDVLPTEIVQLTHQMIREVLEHNQVKEYNYELTIGDKNYIFESRMVPLTKNSTLAIVRDVTERKEAQEALIKAKEKAEESDRLKSAFLANMSHEIRTPINGIIGFTQLLRDQEYTPEERNEFFDIIDLNSKQLLQIINDIIDISKIEANQLIIKKKTFALNQLMDELYNTYRIELSQYSKEHLDLILKKELEDDTDYVFTDMIRLKQIMTNLLGNAIKFTEQGQIEFGYKCTGKNQFIFFVKDTGIGIPKEKQKLIFSHFRRAHESMASKFGGTGLGLSISKKLVEMLGGEIWVESTENRGASFFVHIPIERKAVNASQKEQTTGEPEYQWNEFKIMIVEDNLPSQRFIKEVIKPTHADIILASSSEEALKQFHAHQDINLILMDIKLPDQDGFQTTRAIRQEDKEIPIIATTAYAMETDKKVAIKNGCNDYLAKPINKKELLKTISKYLMIKK